MPANHQESKQLNLNRLDIVQGSPLRIQSNLTPLNPESKARFSAEPRPTHPHPESQRYRFPRGQCAECISALGFHCLSFYSIAVPPFSQHGAVTPISRSSRLALFNRVER